VVIVFCWDTDPSPLIICSLLLFLFSAVLGFELRASALGRQVPLCQSCFWVRYFQDGVSHTISLGLALNHDLLDRYLLSSKDHRHEPQVPGFDFIFKVKFLF
jgi:hypothetical protein